MKKNKKQRFISDKISELKKQGKNQQQSIAIALSMAENVLQTGGTATNVNELITQSKDKLSSAYKPIKNIQKGVTDGKGKSGVYFYYRLPEEGGFDPKVDREFISNDYLSQLRQDPSLKNEALEAYLRKNPTQVFEEGGENELPKYQFGAQQKSYKDPVIGQFYGQDISGGFKGYDTNNPVKTQPQFPTTTYNPSYITPQNNNNSNFSVGNLDLNNPLFTSNNVSGVTTQTPKPTKEEFDQWNSSYKAKNTTTGATTPATTTTKQDGSSFYQGMFSQPNYNPPADLGFNQGEQYYGLGRDKNYVSAISPESLTAGEDWAKNNPLPQGVVSKESGFETPLMDKYAQENVVETPQLQRQTPPIQFANPYGGVDLNAASALFGQSIQQGDTAMGIASGAKLGLGLARNFMSGYSAGVDRNRVLNDYSSNMRNAMTGAETPNQLYQEGGTANEQDQLLQQVAMMLQQGASPEQVVQELVAMGMPQEQAAQMIQMVMQQAPQQEQQMMQEGGVAKQPEVPVEMANAEIEGGEYVKDTEGVKYAEGAKHSEGGIPTQLENGARVLSDYKKVGKDLAKQLSEQVGFEVKASDTFATVLDKFNRKEGFDKKVKHLDEYSDKLEKQEKTVKHDATLALNKQILMEEAQEDTQKLQELVKQQEGLFNMLFEAQEATKVMEEGGNFMQNGGTVNDLMAKYNISAEEASKLIPSFQDAGTYNVPEQIDKGNIYSLTNPNNPLFAGQIPQNLPSNRVANTFEQSSYGYQKPNRDWKDFGNLNKEQQAEVLKDISRVFPSLAQKFLKDGVPTNPAEFQLAINNHYDNIIKDAEKLYPKDSQQYKDFVASVNKERFTIPTDISNIEGLVTDVDAKFGDYTSTRPNFAFDVLPQDVLTEVKNAGINTASELKESFPNYYDKYVKPKNLESDFWLGKVGEQPKEVAPATIEATPETPMEIPTTPVVDVAQDKNRMAFLNLPDQTPMLPWAMQAPAMLRQTIYGLRWDKNSPEHQLTDIQRGIVATAEQMSFLPDSQQASSLFALDANAMAAQNKVRSETERYNQMARERTEAAEADQKTRQSAADVVAAQTYQQQLGNELESNEADWRSWANRVQSNQMNNWDSVERANLYNAYNPNVQRTSSGYEVINEPTFTNDASKKYLAEQEKKPKKKNPVAKDGGTFRGKKSTKRFGK